MSAGIVAFGCNDGVDMQEQWAVWRANRQLGLSVGDGTAAQDASAVNPSASGDRDSSKIIVGWATGRLSAASRVAVLPPSSLCFHAAGRYRQWRRGGGMHKMTATAGRDELPGTETPGALMFVGAGERVVPAAAARLLRRRLRV